MTHRPHYALTNDEAETLSEILHGPLAQQGRKLSTWMVLMIMGSHVASKQRPGLDLEQHMVLQSKIMTERFGWKGF